MSRDRVMTIVYGKNIVVENYCKLTTRNEWF